MERPRINVRLLSNNFSPWAFLFATSERLPSLWDARVLQWYSILAIQDRLPPNLSQRRDDFSLLAASEGNCQLAKLHQLNLRLIFDFSFGFLVPRVSFIPHSK